MITAVEGPPVVTAPRERGWRWLVLALVVAIGVSFVAQWPASLALLSVLVHWLLPIEPLLLLVLAGLGACALASWTRGGRLGVAIAAALGLVFWIWRGPSDSSAVAGFSHGWTLLVAACFGWTCMLPGARSLLGRALTAIAAAAVLAVLLIAWQPKTTGGGLASVGTSFERTLSERRDGALSVWQARVNAPAWEQLAARVPAMARTAERTAVWIAESRPPVTLLPSLLVLETLLALALAWTMWHRLARVRLGPPLGSIVDFRFNDQMVWGLVVGATLVLLPSLSGWRELGLNLLLVFGALYALRGLGILLWWLPDRWWIVPLVILLVCIPLLGPVQVLATVAVLALGLGLGDTWRDFRRTARPLRPNVRP